MNNLIMKTLRFLGMTLLMVMLAANFTACGDDEDEQTIIEQANLIGKWQSTWEKIHKVENGKLITNLLKTEQHLRKLLCCSFL